VICQVLSTSSSPGDRQKFSVLLDVLKAPEALKHGYALPAHSMPTARCDGKGERPTRLSILHSSVLQAIKMLRAGTTAKDLEPVVEYIERVATKPDGFIIGDPATGYSMDWVG